MMWREEIGLEPFDTTGIFYEVNQTSCRSASAATEMAGVTLASRLIARRWQGSRQSQSKR
jgi:hypothetical protein